MSKKKKKREIPTIAGLFDSHAHLDDGRFDEDRDEVIERARQVGVTRILTVDSEPDRVGVSAALAARYPGIHAAAGVHPHEASKVDDEVLERVWKQLVETPRVQAVGEIGLDYYYMNSPKDAQIRVLGDMLHLALESQKPVVVHVRDAHEDAIRILSETDVGRVGGVIHCFSGGLDEAKAYLGMGLCISISGVVTYKKADLLREVAAFVPEDRLLVETDSPYLAPGDRRGRRCEPAFVAFTAEEVARVRGLEPEALAARTTANTMRLFGIEPVSDAVGRLVVVRDGRAYVRVTDHLRLHGVGGRDWTVGGDGVAILGRGVSALPDGEDRGGLRREPVLADLLEALDEVDASRIRDVVVTGGEPTLSWKLVGELVEQVRARGVSAVGLETDGLAALDGGDEVFSDMDAWFDWVAVVMPTGEKDSYVRRCRGPSCNKGFDAALESIRRLKKSSMEVRLVCTGRSGSDLRSCKNLASRLNVAFSPMDDV